MNRLRNWLTLDVSISPGFDEGVSNFLMEQGATGIQEITDDPDRIRLKAYFEENESAGGIVNVLERYLRSVQKIDPSFSYRLETRTIPEKDWGEKWKRFFKPVVVTPRIIVKPPWHRVRLKKGQISVEINPGVAFGTGTHATTKLCIQALQQRLKKKGESVLDVGTGSGILSIVAALLGAGEIWGIDPDEASVENARENIIRNQVSGLVKIRRGTIGSIHGQFDIVLANIDFKVLRKVRWPLVRHVRPGGFLIVAGILEGEQETIGRHYLETGLLEKLNVTQFEEWVCLTFKRSA